MKQKNNRTLIVRSIQTMCLMGFMLFLATTSSVMAQDTRLLQNSKMEAITPKKFPEKLKSKTPSSMKMPKASLRRKAPISDLNQLVGPAVLWSFSSIEGIEDGGNSIEITKKNNSTLEIEHFTLLATNKIQVNVNLSDMTFTIPSKQVLWTHETYGDVVLTALTGNYISRDTPISGYFDEYNTMIITTSWADIDSENDWWEGIWYQSLLVAANGLMEANNNSGKEIYNVYLEPGEDENTVNVLNFGGLGQWVGIKVYNDGHIVIPSQVAYDVAPGKDSDGEPVDDYYTYAANLNGGYYLGADSIVGSVSEKELSFGNWAMLQDISNNLKRGFWYLDGKITLTYEGVYFIETPYCTVETNSLSFPAEGGSQTIKVSSNQEWTFSSSQSWVNCSPSAGSGDATITITVDANTSADSRKGYAAVVVDTPTNYIANRIDINQEGASIQPIEYSADDVSYMLNPADMSATIINIKGIYENVMVPEKVSYNGQDYTVTAIAEQALADAEGFNFSVSLPATITTVAPKAFDNAETSAIIWNSDTQLPANAFAHVDMNIWANMLLYVNKSGIAPSKFANTIVNGEAQNIELQEGKVFHCPQEFIAKKISFTHEFTMQTGIGQKRGWETIALPFDVQTITHATKGYLIPFANYSPSSEDKPFWLYEWSNKGFVKASSMQANVPYLISMPMNTQYSPEYNLAGSVTFSATNALVKTTKGEDIKSYGYNNKCFFANYFFSVDNDNYPNFVINSSNMLHSETGGYAPGSIFVRIKNIRNCFPFEGYLRDDSKDASSRNVIEIEFADDDETQGIDGIMLSSGSKWRQNGIFTVAGQRITGYEGMSEEEVLLHLPSGVYIMNGKKQVVK